MLNRLSKKNAANPEPIKLVIFAAAMLMTGCEAALIKDMDRGLRPFVGKDVHAAIAVLGEPAQQQLIAGDNTYTWFRSVDNESCTLHLVADANNRVVRYDWNGVHKVCNIYDDALNP